MPEYKSIPPAFPQTGDTLIGEGKGMTLRDWFAGMAVSGILASPQLNRMKQPAELASDCYRIADGMLQERAK